MKPYKLSDGRGLCLFIYPAGGKYWRYRYSLGEKETMISLGVYPDISLEEARKRLAKARTAKAMGKDPCKEKQALRQELIANQENTFELIAREWHGKNKDDWSSGYAYDVLHRLEVNLFPSLGSLPIREIKAPEFLSALQKIEGRGAATIAKRCCQTSGQIFRYAVAAGRAEYDVTANLRGALRTKQTTHFNSIKPHELSEFMVALEKYNGDPLTKLAIRLLLLTFVRTNELRGATWNEIHWEAKEWRIPAARMKMKQEHIIPLSSQAMDILTRIKEISGHAPYLFPRINNPKKMMGENTILFALYRMGYRSRATGHGFRRTASTALNDMQFNRDHIEMQLAHADQNQVRGAYNSALYLPDREKMMQHYADYLDAVSVEGRKVTTKDYRVGW